MSLILPSVRPVRLLAAALAMLLPLGLAGCGDENAALVALEKAREFRQDGKLNSAIIELRVALQENPDSAEAHYIFGLIHAEDVGDGDSAEPEFLRARELGMEDEKLRAPLALTWVLKGAYGRALNEIGSTAALPQQEKARLETLRGRAHLGLREYTEAERAFERALRAVEDYAPALVGLGRMALAKDGDTDAARAYVGRALIADPASLDALHLQGDLAIRVKNFGLAEKTLREALNYHQHFAPVRLSLIKALLVQNKLSEAVKHLDAAFLPNPDDPAVILLRAQAAFQDGNYDLAKHHAENALSVAPRSAPGLLLAGAANYATGGYEATVKHMENFLRSNSGNIPARKLYGAALIKLGRSPEAYSFLRPLADDITDDAGLMSLIGSAALAGGDLQEARRFIGQAVELRPENSPDRAKLGITKIVLGDAEEGVQDLDAFLEGVDTPTARSARAFLQAYRNQDYATALTAARGLRKEMPENPLPLTLIGLARMALKDNRGAREAFSEALRLDYDFVPAITGMGALETQNGNLQAALQLYQKAQRLDPNRLLVLLRLAQVELKLGEQFDAVGYLEQAVQKYPTALTPRILLGQIHYRSGQPARGLALTEPMLEHYPSHAGLLEVIGRAQMATNKNTEAVATFRHLVDVLPDSPHSHFYLALAYRNLGDEGRYTRTLDKSLEIDPKYTRALIEKARFKLVQGKLAESRSLVDGIKADQPDNTVVLELDGSLALAEGDFDRSIKTLNKAYGRSANTRIVSQLAQAYWLRGDQEDALDLMKEWLSKVPGDTAVRLKYANLLLAIDRVEDAHGHLEAVVEAAPNNVLARNNLAWTLHRLGRNATALQHAEKAMELAPNHPGVLDTLGVILMGQGKVEEAVVLLQRAVESQPDIPSMRYHYARALAKTGKRPQALAILTKILADKTVTFAEIDDAKSLLEILKK